LGKRRCLTSWPRKLLDAKKPADQARLKLFDACAVGEVIRDLAILSWQHLREP
jgi:hypothetical protein